jgi:hypothetical protein
VSTTSSRRFALLAAQRPPRLVRGMRTLARELADALAARVPQAVARLDAARGRRSAAEAIGLRGVAPWRLGRAASDAYVDWLQESAAVRATYERWSTAVAADVALAFAAYRAALDREEHASRWLQALAA